MKLTGKKKADFTNCVNVLKCLLRNKLLIFSLSNHLKKAICISVLAYYSICTIIFPPGDFSIIPNLPELKAQLKGNS